MTGNVGVMPDNLRERIAKVLYGNLRRQQSIDRPDRFLDWIDTRELADAVIDDLKEHGFIVAVERHDYGQPRPSVFSAIRDFESAQERGSK